MKKNKPLLLLLTVFTLVFIGGSIFSGLYAEYGQRGPNGEYFFDINYGIKISFALAIILTFITGQILWMKKKK